MNYNPYYLAYCHAHGKTPEAMAEHDRERWPGGFMAGYICWINARWQDWRALVGRKDLKGLSAKEREAFGVFLQNGDATAAAQRLDMMKL